MSSTSSRRLPSPAPRDTLTPDTDHSDGESHYDIHFNDLNTVVAAHRMLMLFTSALDYAIPPDSNYMNVAVL